MSTTPTRRGRPGYDLDTLLRVAATTFTERGYDGTSMEDLARKLGITKSAIYHHVSGKDELLRLATDRALDGLSAVIAEAPTIEGRAIDRLEHVV
ncbi:MAG: TetR/AcrR family transcriptional regulator, partial [Jatrophihabitantaceae bacterium]